MQQLFPHYGLSMSRQSLPLLDIDTLSVDPRSVSLYYTIAENSSSRARDGIRLQPAFEGGEGFRELIEIAPGFQVLIGDLRYATPVEFTLREDASLKFHYRLSGASDICLHEDAHIHIGQHTGGVLLHPDGVLKHEAYEAGQHERSVTLICSADYLGRRFASIADSLPGEIADYIAGVSATHYAEHVPLRANMAAAAGALLDMRAEGPLRHLLIEAKALELLALSIEALLLDEGEEARSERGLSSRDLNCLQEARSILDRDFIAPPTITMLARRVGVNEAKLMHAFKQLFGRTIFDYTQALRMEKAKELLEQADLSITEVAFEVGYEYSSNFTTAFKRHFGITPSTARDAIRR